MDKAYVLVKPLGTPKLRVDNMPWEHDDVLLHNAIVSLNQGFVYPLGRQPDRRLFLYHVPMRGVEPSLSTRRLHRRFYWVGESLRKRFNPHFATEYRLWFTDGGAKGRDVQILVTDLSRKEDRANACRAACIHLLQCLCVARRTLLWDLRVLVAKTLWTTRTDDAWDLQSHTSKKVKPTE